MTWPNKLSLWTEGIRNTLILLLPLALIGALANAALYLPLPIYRDTMAGLFGIDWVASAATLVQATNGITGLVSAMVVASRIFLLLDEKDRRQFSSMAVTSLVAAAAFVLGVAPQGELRLEDLGYASLFKGLVLGVFTAEVLHALNRLFPAPRHAIDYQVGDTLQFGIRMALFGAIAMLSAWALSSLLHTGAHALAGGLATVHQALGQVQGLGNWVLNAALVLVNQLLWLVGVNGGQIILQWSQQDSVWIAPPGSGPSHPLGNPMVVNAFAHLGGAGATWGLILAILLRGRDPVMRRLAWASVLPAIINVNELLLFGIPLVFGVRWLGAFLAAPLLNSLLASAVLSLAPVNGPVEAVSWSTPILLSGHLLTGSWVGVATQLGALALSTFIYLPFVQRLEQDRKQDFRAMLKDTLTYLCAPIRDSEGMLERSDRYGRIARALVKEFERDLGSERVYLVYQPVHDVHGRVVSVEALIRWEHAEYGMIPAPAIINPAEECQLIHRIGAFAIDRACRDLAVWRRAGHTSVKVAVNVSPVQLETDALPEVVLQALSRHTVPVDQLKLEVTEGRALNMTEGSDRTLHALQAAGVALSMDDFGMGYTSLLYLQRIKLVAIKLDGCITRDIEHNLVNQDIVRTVARLGSSQGVNVIAEFVETERQQALLRELGCDQFQGWLYSPGLKLPDLLHYLAKRANSEPPPPSAP